MLAFLGIMSVGVFNTLSYVGLNHTTAINGLILQSSGPIVIAIMAFLIFRDRVTRLQGIGILTSLIGVLVVITRADISILKSLTFNVGDIWIFSAMMAWALYTVFLRLRPKIHWQSFASVTFFVGAVFITPFFLWEYINGGRVVFDSKSILAIAYVSIFPSILSYVFFNRSVELIGPNRVGAYLHMAPFFGTIMAIIILGEELQYFHIAGLAMILLGVFMASKKQKAHS